MPETTSYSAAEVARSLVEGIIGLEDGVALFDRHGILLTCNDAYRRAYPLIADLLVPGVSIREILRASAKRGEYAKTDGDVTAWVEARVERHFWSAGVLEHKLANDRWYRITERHTATGHVLKFLTDITEQKRLDEALSLLETNDVQLLLTDINMPVMSGADLLRKLAGNKRWRGLTRVVISTDGSTARREEVAELSVRCYLKKPFSPEVLRDVLTDAAQTARL